MNRTDLFLDKYKQLEEVVKSVYELDDRDSISYYLSNRSDFRKFKDDIRYCQDVRNLLSHKKKIKGSYAIEPSQEMIEFITALTERVRNRPLCRDIQIPFRDVYWQPLNGKVKQAIRVMRKNRYTQVPIIENGVVVGVFDENSVFNYLAHSEAGSISDDLTFSQIRAFTALEDREMQQFIFFSEDSYAAELEDEFEKAFKRSKRLEIAFITACGRSEEKLLGIITPWDIIAVED